jgi:hypothetical protein
MKSSLIFLVFFIAFTSAVKFDCRFTFYTRLWIRGGESFWPIGNVYVCISSNLILDGNSSMISYEGEHVDGFSDNDVELVHFGVFFDPNETCEHLTFIPQGVERFFPNIRGFVYSGCSFLGLQGNEFDSYRNLVNLEIKFTPISHIPGQLLQQTRHLYYMSFWANQIKSVGSGLLDNLYSLSYAIFFDNVCINSGVLYDRFQIRNLAEELNRQCSRLDIVKV